jgi:hypothetical protein
MNRQLIALSIAVVALLSIAGLALRTLEDRHSAPDCALTQQEQHLLHGDGKWDLTSHQEQEPIMPMAPQRER